MAFLDETGLEYLWSNTMSEVKKIGDGIYRKSGKIVNKECLEGRGIGVTSKIEPLQEGSGEPSPTNIRPIRGWTVAKLTRCGKNLLDMRGAAGGTSNGITAVVNADGSYHISGTPSNRDINIWFRGNFNLTAPLFTLQPGTYYLKDVVLFNNTTALGWMYTGGVLTLNEATPVTGVRCVSLNVGQYVDTTVYPAIYSGDSDQEWQSYQGDTYTTDFEQTVYGGTLDWNTGVLTVEWAMVTLDANTSVSLWDSGGSGSVRIAVSDIDDGMLECSHFKTLNSTDNKIAYANTVLGVFNNYQYSQICFSNPTFKTVDDWKAFFTAQYNAGTPVQVVYKLVTPQTIQLDPKQITSLEGKNYLYTNIGTVIVDFNRDNSMPPIASTTNIGLVSTDTQRFRGVKYLEYPRITSNNTRWQGYGYYHPNGTTKVAEHWYDQGDATNVKRGSFTWRQYSPNNTANSSTTGYCEDFSLPTVDIGRTTSVGYSILTTKNLVQVGQGGTGKSSSLEAANMFLNALEVGTSTPQDADYYISQYAGGGTSFNTYHRRPVSSLYQYIKNKAAGDNFNISGISGWTEKLKGIREVREYVNNEDSCVYYSAYLHNTGSAQVGVGDSPTPNHDMWWHFLRFTHLNPTGYYTELAIPFNDNSIYYKRVNAGTVVNSSNNAGWIKVLDELNYSSILDGRYINTSGDTMTGALNFANNVWNNIGDDVAIGDGNIAGHLCIKGLNGATGIYFAPYSGSTGNSLSIDGNGNISLNGQLHCINNSAESSLHANSNAGDIYLYSQGTSTGNRGIYTINPSGTATTVLNVTPDNSMSFYGNSSTASKLATARKIKLTGSITGEGSFDGSGDLNIVTTTNHSHSYLPLSGGTMSGTINSSKISNTYLQGNQGETIINSTASAGSYTMLAKMNSINGYFTTGSYQDSYLLQYTAKSTVDEGNNSFTKSVTLLNESGDSTFPGKVTASSFSGNLSGNASNAIKLNNYYASRQTSANLTADGSGGLINFKATNAMTTGKPITDGHILHMYWDTTTGWDSQFFIPNGNYPPQFRYQNSGTWQNWISFLTANNYSSYALPLSGGTLTGNLNLTPASGEGGEIHLNASSANTSENGIILDEQGGNFRIFGIPSANGSTVTGSGTPLVINPYSKTITGGYTITGTLNGTATGLSSTLPIDKGGTGSTSAEGARANLGIIVSTTAPSNPTNGMIWLELIS